jgi:hypothetical protein
MLLLPKIRARIIKLVATSTCTSTATLIQRATAEEIGEYDPKMAVDHRHIF